MCDYACNQAGNLKRHMKIHSGEKQYKKRNSIGLYVNNESSKRFKTNNQDMKQRATTNEELEHTSGLGNEKIAALINLGNSKKADQRNNKEEDNEKEQKGGRANAGESFACGEDEVEEKEMEEVVVGLVEEPAGVHRRMEEKEMRGGGSEEEMREILGMVEAKDDLGEGKGGTDEQLADKSEKNTNKRLSADITKENCEKENISRKKLRTELVDESADKGKKEESKKEEKGEKTEEKRKERKRKRLENEEAGESGDKGTEEGKEWKKQEKPEKKYEDSHKFKMRLEEESLELELKLLKNPDYRPEPSVFSEENFSDLDHLLEEDEDSDDCPDFQTTEAVFESDFSNY